MSLDTLRLGARTSTVFVTTAAMYGLLDLDTALRAGPARPPDQLLLQWQLRWAKAALSIFNVRLHAQGSFVATGDVYPGRGTEGKGRIFIMNHRSAVDIALAFRLAEARLLSRGDLSGWPLIGACARRAGTLFVDRDDRRSRVEAMGRIIASLRAGRGVTMFPEGTSFAGDEVRPLHPGPFLAARRARTEVIPIGVAYDDERAVFGDETFPAHLQRVGGLMGLNAAAVVGSPLALAGLPAEQARELARDELQRLVYQARQALDDLQ